jgi:hypothetical protein
VRGTGAELVEDEGAAVLAGGLLPAMRHPCGENGWRLSAPGKTSRRPSASGEVPCGEVKGTHEGGIGGGWCGSGTASGRGAAWNGEEAFSRAMDKGELGK